MGPRLCFPCLCSLLPRKAHRSLGGDPFHSLLMAVLSILPSRRNFMRKIYVSLSLQGNATASPTSYFNEQDCKVSPDKLKRSCTRSQTSSRLIWGLTFNERSLGQCFPLCLRFGAAVNQQPNLFSFPALSHFFLTCLLTSTSWKQNGCEVGGSRKEGVRVGVWAKTLKNYRGYRRVFLGRLGTKETEPLCECI